MLDVQSIVKYLLEGMAVAVAAYYIPQRSADLKEIAIIGLTAAAVFAILDTFAPAVATGARHGSGFGIGYNITQGLEGFSEEEQAAVVAVNDLEDTSDEIDEDVPMGDDSGEAFSSIL